MTQAAPGWYGDPLDSALLRWWDGSSWSTTTTESPRAAGIYRLHDGRTFWWDGERCTFERPHDDVDLRDIAADDVVA